MNRTEAGLKGSEVKDARYAFKASLKAGPEPLIELLYEPDLPSWARGMYVSDVLSAVTRIGVREAESLLAAIPAKLTATFDDLTYRKRRALVDALKAREAGSHVKSDRGALPRGRGVGRAARVQASRMAGEFS